MKKLVFLFGVLSLVFVSCNKDNNKDDGTPNEQELTYSGTYAGSYRLSDTAYEKNAIFYDGLLKNRLKLYGVVNFDMTDTAGFFRANVSDLQMEAVKLLLSCVGVNVPANADKLIKGLNATARFDGSGKVDMDLNFDFDVQIVDTMKLNWQLIHFEGLRQ